MTIKLQEYGFQQSAYDHCLFTKGVENEFLALIVYVDDLLIAGAKEQNIIATKKYLDLQFTNKDLGHAKYFLSIEITQLDKGMLLNQRIYILDILTDT